MAASLVDKHQDSFSGLIFLAAYPAKGNDLSSTRLPVLSLVGQFDLLATEEKIEKARPLLPTDTRYVTIVGGNHAWFGNYGKQKGDGKAFIEPEEQWDFTAREIAKFLGSI
jgi:pimeloyl-ACP methyl ester carboxylesterase